MADDFPYKRFSMTQEEIEMRMNNLRKWEPTYLNMRFTIRNLPSLTDKELQYCGQWTVLQYSASDYLNLNLISDYFNDQQRVHAKRSESNRSPYECWQTEKEKIFEYAKRTYGKIDPYTLREAIYHCEPGAGTFRPTTIVAMIRKFNSKRVLDFSSGWGDRLIGALACNVDYYCGVDPNSSLQSMYKEILDYFKPSTGRYETICAPFEDAEIPYSDFDLVCTCPPYFNLEIYNNESTQSVVKYPTLADWYNNFLLASITKAWNLLCQGGYLALIVNDTPTGVKFTDRMIKDTSKLAGASYCGCIAYGDVSINRGGRYIRNPQPIWIWRKIKDKLYV